MVHAYACVMVRVHGAGIIIIFIIQSINLPRAAERAIEVLTIMRVCTRNTNSSIGGPTPCPILQIVKRGLILKLSDKVSLTRGFTVRNYFG